MTKLKKIIVCILALCIVSTAFCGCKDDTSKSTESSVNSSEEESSDTSESESDTLEVTTHDDEDLPVITDTDGEYTTSVEELDASETVPTIKDPQPTIAVNLEDYIAQNPDTKAWINIPGTYVNYPVLQSDDNDFYLHRNTNKEYSYAGTLFADWRNVLTGPDTSDNIVIYGHNMANGSYFGSLNNYKSLSFYKKYPIVKFKTTEEAATYVIVAVFYTNTVASQDNGIEWKYFLEHDFDTTTAFNTWKDNVSKRSFYTTSIDYDKSDKYLTLSTCSNVAGQDAGARLVVIARKTRENEEIDTNGIAVVIFSLRKVAFGKAHARIIRLQMNGNIV